MPRTIAFIAGLLIGGWLAFQVVEVRAQDDTCATPAASTTVTSGQRLLGQADFELAEPGQTRLTSTQITLAPGSSTAPFVNAGPVLIVVQDGTVTLTADQAQIGQPPEPSVGGIEVDIAQASPVAADAVAVTRGEQIALPANSTAQLSNNSDEGVRILLVSLNPTGF